MPKIVFIGAGSFGFTRGLVRDILTFPLLKSSEIALVDINKGRLNFARRACQSCRVEQLWVSRKRSNDGNQVLMSFMSYLMH